MKYHLAVKKINILKYIVISKQPFLSLDVANPIEKNHIFFFYFSLLFNRRKCRKLAHSRQS